jgi:hypothetical protein
VAEEKELYLGYATDKAVTPFLADWLKNLE